MPKITKELSTKDLKNIQVGTHFIGGVGSLTLEVKPSKSKDLRPASSWVLRVYFGSKRRNLGLGSYPEISIAEERRKALELKAQCAKGIDPLREKQLIRIKANLKIATNKTFKQIAEDYLSAHANDYRNKKHQQQWRNTITTYAYPSLGHIPIRDISLEQIIVALEPIWHTKTEIAKRLQGRLEKIFDLAITMGLRETNPARWQNSLSTRLPLPSRISEVKH